MKTIIGFSGGLDSTYVLWKALTDTQDEITAVFIRSDSVSTNVRNRYDLRSFSGTHEEESVAASVANWLSENVRPFTFLPVDFDEQYVVRGFGFPNSPQTYLARYAAAQMGANLCDRLMLCTEKENDGWANAGTIETRRTGGEAAREVFASIATRGSIEWPLIASNYTQAYALHYLPPALLVLAPPCDISNQSYKCNKRRWFQNLLSQGQTPSQTWETYYQQCTSYPNKWYSMKLWLQDVTATDQNTWGIPEWATSYSVPLS